MPPPRPLGGWTVENESCGRGARESCDLRNVGGEGGERGRERGGEIDGSALKDRVAKGIRLRKREDGGQDQGGWMEGERERISGYQIRPPPDKKLLLNAMPPPPTAERQRTPVSADGVWIVRAAVIHRFSGGNGGCWKTLRFVQK